MKKTLIVPEEILEDMLDQWPDMLRAEWRVPKCWCCGRRLFFRMWHVPFRKAQREAHLCRKCGKPYEV
jgi:hypothetical protein